MTFDQKQPNLLKWVAQPPFWKKKHVFQSENLQSQIRGNSWNVPRSQRAPPYGKSLKKALKYTINTMGTPNCPLIIR